LSRSVSGSSGGKTIAKARPQRTADAALGERHQPVGRSSAARHASEQNS